MRRDRAALAANTYMFIGNAARTRRITAQTAVAFSRTLREIHKLPAITVDEQMARQYSIHIN